MIIAVMQKGGKMQKRKFDEMISYFNRKVSDMEIDRKYKMELLAMITAIGMAHERELNAQQEVIRCKDCKNWRQQTNYQGAPLSFGFCESDDMWLSLYGETCEVSHIDTDDDFYCGYAERRTDEQDD